MVIFKFQRKNINNSCFPVLKLLIQKLFQVTAINISENYSLSMSSLKNEIMSRLKNM